MIEGKACRGVQASNYRKDSSRYMRSREKEYLGRKEFKQIIISTLSNRGSNVLSGNVVVYAGIGVDESGVRGVG